MKRRDEERGLKRKHPISCEHRRKDLQKTGTTSELVVFDMGITVGHYSTYTIHRVPFMNLFYW
jgi:hypothetical protein